MENINDSTGDPMEEMSSFDLSGLPEDFRNQSRIAVGTYSVPIVVNGELCGSGTLIRCGDTYGILTAHHVVKQLDFTANSDKKLYLSVADFPHRLTFEMRNLASITIAEPVSDESGPDMAFIKFPPSAPLGEIKARKSFLDISVVPETKLQESLYDDGLWIVVGFPGQLVASVGVSSSSTPAVCFRRIAFGVEQVVRSEFGEFDYLEILLDCPVKRWSLSSFGGMSGCGVWRVPIYRDGETKEFLYRNCYLAGIAFYQTEEADNSRRLRCHGGRSIFVQGLKSLREAGY